MAISKVALLILSRMFSLSEKKQDFEKLFKESES